MKGLVGLGEFRAIHERLDFTVFLELFLTIILLKEHLDLVLYGFSEQTVDRIPVETGPKLTRTVIAGLFGTTPSKGM
ncbi:hypothetical protein RB195_026264 [Necator americanus]|uniref:Uncharacterized protein n=1 Tax=Necator americanus TaxID=51031 RepID=A0ABR1EWD2_NECAM